MDYEQGIHIQRIVQEVAVRVSNRFKQVGGTLLEDKEYNLLVCKEALVESEIALIRAGFDRKTRASFWPLDTVLDAMNAYGYERVNYVYNTLDERDALFGVDNG